jgi:uncharacterized membrane protein YfhO
VGENLLKAMELVEMDNQQEMLEGQVGDDLDGIQVPEVVAQCYKEDVVRQSVDDRSNRTAEQENLKMIEQEQKGQVLQISVNKSKTGEFTDN